MNRDNDEIEELSYGKRLACNLVAAACILLAGLFLLLCGTDVINIPVSKAACGTLLCAVGLMLIISAIISHNSVSLWLSFCFLVPALVELLVKTTTAGYAELYPIYIAIPAIASLFAMIMTRDVTSHLGVIILFGVVAGIFALKSGNVVGWEVVIPALVVFAGAIMLFMALRKKDDKDEF